MYCIVHTGEKLEEPEVTVFDEFLDAEKYLIEQVKTCVEEESDEKFDIESGSRPGDWYGVNLWCPGSGNTTCGWVGCFGEEFWSLVKVKEYKRAKRVA